MKKRINLFIAFLLIFCITLSSFSTIDSQAESKNNGTIKICVPAGAMIKGDSKKLSIQPKGTKIKSYSSSNKKVISVTKKGKITALKSGTSTITVKTTNGKKATIKIKVFKPNSDMIFNRKIKGKKALWHIKNGKVVKKAGFATDGINWYYSANGQVSKKTGIFSGKIKGSTSKWYVIKGKAALDYSGPYKEWFVNNGKVSTSLNGIYHANNKTYKVKNGKIIDQVDGIIDAFFGDEVLFSQNDKRVIGNPNISIKFISLYENGSADFTFTENGVDTNLYLTFENNKAVFSPSSYIKNYNIEFVEKIADSFILKVTPKNTEIQKPMSISGKASDHYTTSGYEYIESDHIIMFMDKGVKFDGNILVKFEEYIKAVEEATGLTGKPSKSSYSQFLTDETEIFKERAFEGIDTENKKIHIFVKKDVHPHCWAIRDSHCYIALNLNSLEVNDPNKLNTDFIHEYTHYVHLTNAPSFNSITNEGYASYIEITVASKLLGKNIMTDSQFYDDYTYQYILTKGKITASNAESTFISGYPDGPDSSMTYNYGFTIMTYLHQTYGKDAFKMLFKEGEISLEKQHEEQKNTQEIQENLNGKNTAELYKKVYSQNFFNEFANWLKSHPEYEVERNYIEE